MIKCVPKYHGPLTRYVKLRVAHVPGMSGTFSRPPTSKETANWRSRHASRHVRHARAVMHVGIANRGGIPDGCATRSFTYLARGPWIGAVATYTIFNTQGTPFYLGAAPTCPVWSYLVLLCLVLWQFSTYHKFLMNTKIRNIHLDFTFRLYIYNIPQGHCVSSYDQYC